MIRDCSIQNLKSSRQSLPEVEGQTLDIETGRLGPLYLRRPGKKITEVLYLREVRE